MGEEISILEWIGYSLLLIFFTLYTVVRANETTTPRRDQVEVRWLAI